MSASNQPASLLCSLCPKQPRFSDISHLLTHISSKSHLSHHFKLQIRSQSDAEAKKKLDDFDRWYRGNGFDIRLSERLALKEQKKAAAKKICPSSNVVKKYTPVEDIKPSLERITPVPQIHLWPTTTTGPPIPCSHFGAQPMREIPTRATAPLYNYWDCTIAKEEAPTDTSILYEDNLTEDEYPEVNPKLKGDNVWPGMNLFDSATEEMRRLRNQRKDGSFVERMMANSTEIEALECVYDAGGEFVDARDIFALPSTENSPKRVLTPKRLRPRRALGDIDKNIPRTSNAEPSKVDPEQPATNLPSGLSGARSYVPTSDEDEEFKMTVGEIMNNKRSFNIFQDSPDKSKSVV
ncbi:hypothetical protein F5884DRAFT_667381 [Xylogone sp. PMI_703]|nr:hypothetical protein F5884DRAFT_667381 [Xylogone sp. PMI_703]